jgi:hypothetical protein
MTGIPRRTILEWRSTERRRGRDRRVGARVKRATDCFRCRVATFDEDAYAYLLGLYLGDGCLSRNRATYVIRIVLDTKYPGIIEEAVLAIAAMRTMKQARVWRVQKVGCLEIASAWNHWPCVFPQHGPGRKHERRIRLQPWQQDVADRYPFRLLRGLIHSDGYRGMNRVRNGRYEYPRYLFTNRSPDILAIFARTCERVGVAYRFSKPDVISVARRESVARLDAHIGTKR